MLYLQDNARPHIANLVKEKIAELNFKIIDHPPYSPDLAPSDFHLFSHLKRNLRGKSFSSLEEMKAKVLDFFEKKPESFHQQGLEMYPSQLSKCIEAHGGYFN